MGLANNLQLAFEPLYVMLEGCRDDIECNLSVNKSPKPNPDIAGTGVVIGFLGTAYVVFCLLVAHYVVAFDPNALPGNLPSQSSGQPVDIGSTETQYRPKPNPIDVYVLSWIRNISKRVLQFFRIPVPGVGKARSARIQDCFEKAIASMCDIQAITGISVLTGGFICLDGKLSAHHWDLIVNLAWFSSITHLSGLTALRRYLRLHHSERNARVSIMFVLLVMLVIAMEPTAFFNWRVSHEERTGEGDAAVPSTPAICLFSIPCAKALYLDSSYGDESLALLSSFHELLISLVFLLVGFGFKMIKLSARLSNYTNEKMCRPVDVFIRGLYNKLDGSSVRGNGRASHSGPLSCFWRDIITRPMLAVMIVTRTHITLLNSMLAELFWLFVTLLWGTMKLTRSLEAEAYYVKKADNEEDMRWEFGQVLPVLLLAAPLVTMFGIFSSTTGPGQGSSASEASTTQQGFRNSNTLTAVNTFAAVSTAIGSLNMIQLRLRERHQGDEDEGEGNSSPRAVGHHATRSFEEMEHSVNTTVLVAQDLYLEMWMFPYLISSSFVFVGHVFGLFVCVTNLFYRNNDGTDSMGIWTPMDYLFTTRGVLVQVILSHPFAAWGIVLSGITVDEWWGSQAGQKGRTRQTFFWIFAVLVHAAYLWIIYIHPYDMQWHWLYRMGMLVSVTIVFLILYVITCLVVCLSRSRPRGRLNSTEDADTAALAS